MYKTKIEPFPTLPGMRASVAVVKAFSVGPHHLVDHEHSERLVCQSL